MQTWIFQANPDRFDIDQFLDEGRQCAGMRTFTRWSAKVRLVPKGDVTVRRLSAVWARVFAVLQCVQTRTREAFAKTGDVAGEALVFDDATVGVAGAAAFAIDAGD